jgi:mono/diheme cytochrome c family protein
MNMVSRILIGAVVAGGLIQFIPASHPQMNPAVVQEPAWDSPQTRALAKRACFNCHSNETVWPWYSQVAPISWLTERDVNKGRSNLNFSEWNKPHPTGDEIIDQIESGTMPLWFYLPTHPEARLKPEEKAALIAGIERSLTGSGLNNQPGSLK